MAAWLFLSGLGAGGLGAMLGIGGGIVLVPLLHLVFGLPLPVTVAVSLCCVIATSTGAAASYVRSGRCDVRLGMQLELFTVAGAIVGSLVAPMLPARALQILFGLATLPVVRNLLFAPKVKEEAVTLPVPVRNLRWGCAAAVGAGALSGTLGIGGGAIKVPVMNLLMGVPFKVATATSNFTIGVTAAASAFVYMARGSLDLAVAVPTVLGVLAGAALGARLMPHVPTRRLQQVFGVLLLLLGGQMVLRGLGIDWSMLA